MLEEEKRKVSFWAKFEVQQQFENNNTTSRYIRLIPDKEVLGGLFINNPATILDVFNGTPPEISK